MNSLEAIELKEKAIKSIKYLKARQAGFKDFNVLMKANGLSASVGMDSVINKISKLDEEIDKKTIKKLAVAIDDYLKRHIMFASKRIYIYKLNKSQLLNIKSGFHCGDYFSDRLEKGNEKSFDITLPENKIKKTSLKISLSKTLEVFYIKGLREYINKESMPSLIDEIDDNDVREVIDVFKVIRNKITIFDFIALDLKNEALILGLDLESSFIRAEMNKSYARLYDIFKNHFNITNVDPMDLRPCIEKMEQEKTGNILKHKFSTDNGGYSHTSGSTSKKLDTRSDKFYINGEKNSILDYYGTIKRYSLQKNEEPIISIEMSYREYAKSAFSKIDYAVITDVKTEKGFQFCIDKIFQHA